MIIQLLFIELPFSSWTLTTIVHILQTQWGLMGRGWVLCPHAHGECQRQPALGLDCFLNEKQLVFRRTPPFPQIWSPRGWNRLLALLLHLYFTAAVSNTNSNYLAISPCSAPGIKHSLCYKDYLLSISRAKLQRDRAWKLRQLRNSLQVTAMVCSLWGQNLNMVLQNLFWTEPCGSTHRFSSQTNGVQISTLLFTSCVTLEKSLNDSLS